MSAFVVDDVKSYTVKMGRWRSDSLRVLGHEQFWSVAVISHQSRLPLKHFHCFCQEQIPAGGGGHIRRLVTYRGAKFQQDYTEMLKDEGTMFFQTRFAFCPDHVEWINRMATALIALYDSSMMRRTVIPLGRRPCLVFLMWWFCQELGPDSAWGGWSVRS